MDMLFLLLQETESADGGWMSMLPLFLILVVFYFFFIRPQTKKNKDQKKFREELKKGFQNKSITVLANTEPNSITLRIKAKVILPERN